MKTFAFALLCCCVLLQSVGGTEDYVISIDGAEHQIGLDKVTPVKLRDGTTLTVRLKQNEFLQFDSDLFHFKHPNQFKPTQADLGDGIRQTMMMSPTGTGVIIQEYSTMSPATLVDMLMRELTKEEVQYGYEYAEEAVNRRVDGHQFRGKQAVTTYQGDSWTRAVLAAEKKDKGVLIITMIEKENHDREMQIIDDFWKSLKLKLD